VLPRSVVFGWATPTSEGDICSTDDHAPRLPLPALRWLSWSFSFVVKIGAGRTESSRQSDL